MKNKIKNLILLLGIIIIFMIILEVFLRIFSFPVYGFGAGAFTFDEDLGYRITPNYSGVNSIYGKSHKIETNSKGMRDFREYSYEKPEGVYRIILIGDSFIFGNGVELEQSMAEILRTKSNNTEIINMGVPGYGLVQEYDYFMKEGIKYKPDLIIFHFASNDWGTHIKGVVDLIADKNGYIISKKEGKLRYTHLFLLRTFRGYSFFYTKSRNLLDFILYTDPTEFQGKDSKWLKDSEGLSNFLSNLRNQSNLIVFVAPDKSYLVKNGRPIEMVKSLDEITTELDIPFMFIENEDPAIFLKIDGHWNIGGNVMVANKLYKFIEDNKNEKQNSNI